MHCEFEYCVYNSECTCVLFDIEIDSLGMCRACEIVDVPKEIIDSYKKKRLDEIDEIWKDYDNEHPE